jgi:hypothetical protein
MKQGLDVSANELKLTPSDMGLVQVAIDASRGKAGATQAKIKSVANLHATALPTNTDRFLFRRLTDSWVRRRAKFRSCGTLKINRTETLSDGSVVSPDRHDRQTAITPERPAPAQNRRLLC